MLKARIQRLERITAPANRGGVLRQLPGESVEQAIERAGREGRTVQFMVMPAIPSPEQWEAEAAANQQRLIERAAVFMRGGFKSFGSE